jgi:hypothetical protein
MATGDKVLALLVAKIACCGLLVLGATGALGGRGTWLLDGRGKWWLTAALIVAIGALLPGRHDRRHGAEADAPSALPAMVSGRASPTVRRP